MKVEVSERRMEDWTKSSIFLVDKPNDILTEKQQIYKYLKHYITLKSHFCAHQQKS